MNTREQHRTTTKWDQPYNKMARKRTRITCSFHTHTRNTTVFNKQKPLLPNLVLGLLVGPALHEQTHAISVALHSGNAQCSVSVLRKIRAVDRESAHQGSIATGGSTKHAR